MPRVRLPMDSYHKCNFATSSFGWRRMQPADPEKEEAFKAVVEDAVLAAEAALEASTLPRGGYAEAIKSELAHRIAAREQHPQPIQPLAAAPDALLQPPAAEPQGCHDAHAWLS